MKIAAAGPGDWAEFLALAGLEGWRVLPQEVDLFAAQRVGNAFALREGETLRGFVTAVGHERTGWIGNLLVPADCRGRGCGTLLFAHALEELRRRGCRSLWLTASEQGRPLYERRGFVVLDGIERWVLPPSGEPRKPWEGNGAEELLIAADGQVWGESRARLLRPLTVGGTVCSFGTTVALLQQGEKSRVLGPWFSPEACPRENRQLLAALLGAAGGAEVVVDVLTSSSLQALLMAAGFTRRGGCALMAAGAYAGVELSSLVALASLGSLG